MECTQICVATEAIDHLSSADAYIDPPREGEHGVVPRFLGKLCNTIFKL